MTAGARRLTDGSAAGFDPYRVLGVTPDTGADEVRSAYQRELATAARHGALQRAQEVDRAWSVLSDPARLRRYERLGDDARPPRLAPDDRYTASRAVPFRAWAPTEGPPTSTVVPHGTAERPSSWRRAVLVLVLLAGLLWAASWLQHGLARPDAGGPAVRTVEVTCGPTATTLASTWTGPEKAVPACPAGATTQVRPLA